MSLFDMTDTFEGSTEAVGNLNAMLGGPYLNAVEMTMAETPVERMEMLQQAFQDAGLSVDDMSRRQIQAFTKMVPGIENAEQLTNLLEGDFDQLGSAIGTAAESDSELVDSLAKQRMPEENLKVIEQTGTAIKGVGDFLIGVNETGFIDTINSAEELRSTLKDSVGPEIQSIMDSIKGVGEAVGMGAEAAERRRTEAIEEREGRRAKQAYAHEQAGGGKTVVLQVQLEGRTIAEAIAPFMQKP
jgi:hypothetical protein